MTLIFASWWVYFIYIHTHICTIVNTHYKTWNIREYIYYRIYVIDSHCFSLTITKVNIFTCLLAVYISLLWLLFIPFATGFLSFPLLVYKIFYLKCSFQIFIITRFPIDFMCYLVIQIPKIPIFPSMYVCVCVCVSIASMFSVKRCSWSIGCLKNFIEKFSVSL